MLSALATLGLVILIGLFRFPSFGEDSDEYRNLMLNRWDLVHQPFSSRFLHAQVVWLLMSATKMSVQAAAISVASVTLALTVTGLALIFAHLNINPLLLLPVMLGYAFVETFRLIYMPDLFYTFLLTILFLLQIRKHYYLSAGMIFVLFCARESTLVLGLVMVGLAIHALLVDRQRRLPHRNWWFVVAAFCVATFAGSIFNRYVTSKSASNVHNINAMVYLVGKVPFNFLKNVLGIAPWTNTLVATEGDHPLYRHALPHNLHLGGIHEIGIAEISARYPLRWLINSLCMFGVLFTVIWHDLFTRIFSTSSGVKIRLQTLVSSLSSIFSDRPFFFQVGLLYGLLSLAIAPILGTAVHRYIYYAWPAFWICGVWVIQQKYLEPGREVSLVFKLRLLLIHLLLAAISAGIGYYDPRWLFLAALLLCAIALQYAAWVMLTSITSEKNTVRF